MSARPMPRTVAVSATIRATSSWSRSLSVKFMPQESYRQKRLHALEWSALKLCERGRYTDALAAGLGAVRCEPLRESAHRRVIQVHLAEGNHSEALRHYDGYRRLLADELGLQHPDSISPLTGPPAPPPPP